MLYSRTLISNIYQITTKKMTMLVSHEVQIDKIILNINLFIEHNKIILKSSRCKIYASSPLLKSWS